MPPHSTTSSLPVDVDPELRLYLYHLYGARAADVLAPARERPELLERLHSEGQDIAAQVPYAAEREWAMTTEDVLKRRTMLAYRGLTDEATGARVSAFLADLS